MYSGKLLLLSNSESRVRSLYSAFHQENIEKVTLKQLLGMNRADFNNNTVVIGDSLSEIESMQLNDLFYENSEVTLIDMFDNFEGLPVNQETFYIPDIDSNRAEKIATKVWGELQATSDINRFQKFKNQEVKAKRHERLQNSELEEGLVELRDLVSKYEKEILSLKKTLEDTNKELDEKAETIRNENLAKEQLQEQVDKAARQKRDLQTTIEQLQVNEDNYREMLAGVSSTHDVSEFLTTRKIEERKSKLIRKAKEDGKVILGVIGKGKSFILNAIEDNDRLIAVEDPPSADYWLIVTTPDPEAIDEFKQLVMKKPIQKSLQIMTLWDESYPFTAESIVDNNLDLVIPYSKEVHQLALMGEKPETSWTLKLNNLIRDSI